MTTLAELKALGEALPVWPEAEIKNNTFEIYYDCPLCCGDGTLPGELCGNKDAMSWAGGVQFYGIGEEHRKCEEFYNAARNHWAALIAIAEAAKHIEHTSWGDVSGNWIVDPDDWNTLRAALARLAGQGDGGGA